MNKFNDINSAIDYVINRRNMNLGLENFKKIMSSLGNPQDDFKVIHVAGTNGKGSTISIIRDVLMFNGFKIGTFTSPHLITHQDRIRINNINISDEKFIYYLNKYYDLIEENNLSMFEIDTLIMSVYFKESNIDYGIIETGIGGRLDCTNIFNNPLVSVITTIGFDHIDRLGDTLDKIAYEKAGIIKENSNVVVGYLNDLAMKVIYDKAVSCNCKLYLVRPYKIVDTYEFSYEKVVYSIDNNAKFLIDNACVALEVIDALDLSLELDKTKKAIKQSNWPGRFERLTENIIIDGAHNEEGVIALIESMKNYKRPYVVVFSALKDKPVLRMIDLLKEASDMFILCEFDFYRAIKIDEYDDGNIIRIKDYKKAISEGLKNVQDGTLFVCGSLYFISEVRKHILDVCK
ncbi:MAG: folylpolyglutamate synthase/dihydrofolate synthase family protein [Bacillota bacterium]|jgi:dihydrofolate synthase/folylpolyglutamate synthase|nr:folylpolyglutamate synthase/dihydrofolate synthase family protein [Bacillota bacterium]